MKDYQPGNLVKIVIINKQYTGDGFAAGGILSHRKDEMTVYRRIDIEEFPSCSDFIEPSTKVRHGDVCTIIRKIGRPWRISQSPKWDLYDVYEVMLTNKSIRQMFKYNIEVVEK